MKNKRWIKFEAGSLAVFCAVGAFVCPLSGADWPQFMGPNSDGTSAEKGLLRAWPAGGPKVLWTVSLGPGYGGAAVRDQKVYVFDRVDQKQDVLRCLDLNTGREEWAFGYDAPGQINHDGSRSTPAVTQKHLFTVGPFGHFHCLDRQTHQVVWKKQLLNDYRAKPPRWAVAQSPVLSRDMVIVAPQANDVGMIACDQATGQERWRTAAFGPMAYATPRVVSIDGMDQVILVNETGVFAVSAADGKSLWSFKHPCKIPIPNVTVLGQNRLFVTGGYNAGSAIIRVGKRDGRWAVETLASVENVGGQCHPGLVARDHVFLLCNTNERSDGMVCFDFNGRMIWQTKRNPFLCKGGSILTGDGLIYVMDGSTGELHIVEPSPDGFRSLGKTKLLAGKEIWGPLALSEGRLLIRDQSQMKCVDLKAQ